MNINKAWWLILGAAVSGGNLYVYTDLSYNPGGSFVRERDSFNTSAKINSQTITDNYIFLYSNNN